MATDVSTAYTLISTIHGCFNASSAAGLASGSYVKSLEIKSLALSEMVAQHGSEKANFPALTFFMIS